jgi:hypothetical protein
LDIVRTVIAAPRERFNVMELELDVLPAAFTLDVDVSTAAVIALEYRALDCSRYMAGRRFGIRGLKTLPRFFRLGVALGLQPFELLRHRFFNDGGQISVRYR